MTTPASPAPVPAAQVHDRHPLVPALFVLTAVSGLVDAVSYLGLGHVFTANMTGNVVVIGFALAGTDGFSITGSLTSLAAFLAGSVLAGRLAAGYGADRRAPWLRAALLAETALQAVAAAVAFACAPEGTRGYGAAPSTALIALLALAMGLRNGTVRKLGVPDLTTTVLTLTLTGLAADSSLAGGDNPRLARRLGSVLAMLAGAAPGAALVVRGHLGWALLAGAVLVGTVALGYREGGREGRAA
ncbi:membrane protein [Kitasatospora phosalacinea]|uniref:Membrane protein n=1 Tax=Kitasatospora phosalacinea TaxID=2065 RepID=A0A9W6Q1H5_9ACTN|nr:YoaK family protein [Kitasatospora phosalacinea]GLW68230.1 membrane protein [Kitasatospora phosalacinea]